MIVMSASVSKDAAIDIGSNAVRLLIKSIDREAVQEKKLKK